MTPLGATAMLYKVKDVEEWNQTRETIKGMVTQEDWFENYVPVIDASGLIVEVLGKDEIKRRYN